MSEVQRITVLWPVGPHGYGNYPVVLASVYDAAQSELAALREELATTEEMLNKANAGLVEWRVLMMNTEQRLADAERRNSELVELLTEHQWEWEQYDSHSHREGGYYCVECQEPKALGHESGCKLAAALQPTESGAS